jgi:glycosyl transferase, family 25
MLQTILDAFDRTYIINLRDRSDRRRGVLRELKRHGVRVDADQVRFYTAERPASRGAFPSRGARGSFSSHAAVLRQALEDDLETVLVLEDDIRISHHVERHGIALTRRLRQTSWDILYLGYLEPEAPAGDALLVDWDGPTIGGHFYAVHRRVLPRIISFMDACRRRPAGHPAGGPTFRDGAFNRFRQENPDVRTLVTSPCLAGQRSSRTDLHELAWFDRIRIMRPLVNGARWVKNTTS